MSFSIGEGLGVVYSKFEGADGLSTCAGTTIGQDFIVTPAHWVYNVDSYGTKRISAYKNHYNDYSFYAYPGEKLDQHSLWREHGCGGLKHTLEVATDSFTCNIKLLTYYSGQEP